MSITTAEDMIAGLMTLPPGTILISYNADGELENSNVPTPECVQPCVREMCGRDSVVHLDPLTSLVTHQCVVL